MKIKSKWAGLINQIRIKAKGHDLHGYGKISYGLKIKYSLHEFSRSWPKIINLIWFTTYAEDHWTLNTRIFVQSCLQEQEQNLKIPKKSVRRISFCRPIQGVLKLPIACWQSPGANPIICQAWNAQNRPTTLIRFAFKLKIVFNISRILNTF